MFFYTVEQHSATFGGQTLFGGLLTGFAEEVDGMRQLGLLQLQLALRDELQQLVVPQDGEVRGNFAALLQDAALQLHVAVRNQLAHHRLALDLVQRRTVRLQQREGGVTGGGPAGGRVYLEVVHLPDNGLAQPGQGVRVLAGRHHVVVPDGGEALVAEQLLLDLGQARLELLLLADVGVSSHQDDG